MTAYANIRPFRHSDADDLARIYRDAVNAGGPRAYTPEQVAVWLSIAPDAASIARTYADGRLALVATDDNDRAIGFADHDPHGHIRYLYVDPSSSGRGLGRELLAAIERHAAAAGLSRLHAEASEVAVGVFERAGFERCERRELRLHDTAIHNYAVVKTLTSS